MTAKMVGPALLSLVLVAGAAGAQDVYKWIDDEGVTSYGETPPDGVPAIRTDLRYSRTDRVVLQERLEEQQALKQAAATRRGQEREAADEAKTVAEKNQQIRRQNCELAMQRQEQYSQARRLYRPTEDGGRDYLTDDELDAERAEAIRAVSEWCDQK